MLACGGENIVGQHAVPRSLRCHEHWMVGSAVHGQGRQAACVGAGQRRAVVAVGLKIVGPPRPERLGGTAAVSLLEDAHSAIGILEHVADTELADAIHRRHKDVEMARRGGERDGRREREDAGRVGASHRSGHLPCRPRPMRRHGATQGLVGRHLYGQQPGAAAPAVGPEPEMEQRTKVLEVQIISVGLGDHYVVKHLIAVMQRIIHGSRQVESHRSIGAHAGNGGREGGIEVATIGGYITGLDGCRPQDNRDMINAIVYPHRVAVHPVDRMSVDILLGSVVALNGGPEKAFLAFGAGHNGGQHQ